MNILVNIDGLTYNLILSLCPWYSACCDIFPTVEYAYTAIPTYPSGQIGFMLLSNTAQGNH